MNHESVSTPTSLQPPPRDSPRWQLGLSLSISIVNIAQFARPTAFHPWWVWLLLAVNVVLGLVRVVPEDRLGSRTLRTVSGGTVLAAAGIIAVDSAGFAVLFAYFFAGHIGYRRPDLEGVAWGALTSFAATVGLLIGIRAGLTEVPWYVGTLTGLPVFIGIANSNRVRAASAARSAAQSAERAALARADTATLTERNRIARELHDVLAHSLAGVNLQLEAVDALLEAGATERARTAVATAQQLVRQGISGAGDAVRALRGDSRPLPERLGDLLTSSARSAADLNLEGVVRPVPDEVLDALHRGVQESLTNASKYAPGASVQVELTYLTDAVTVRVTNGPTASGTGSRRDGIARGSGLGLMGMRERMAEVGGAVRAGPIAGGELAGGWRVELGWPVDGLPAAISDDDGSNDG